MCKDYICSYTGTLHGTRAHKIREVTFDRSEGVRKVYFIPVRYGIGVWPDGRAVGASSASSEIQVVILTGELYLEFFIWIWGPDERYLAFENGVLLRMSIQIPLA